MKRTLALFLLTLVCGVVSVKASVLEGQVVEVHDGRTVTVENTGRRIKVALKAADAPERDQPYGEAARQHLAALVLKRYVSIEYTGLGPQAILIGRLFCDDRDVGLQMIRDGAAWFDRSYEANLGALESSSYAESERAARSERRGLWQDAAPVPPWEWRQARASKMNRRRRLPASVAHQPAGDFSAGAGASTHAGSASPRGKTGDTKWPIFSPTGAPFSVRIPEGGFRYTTEIQVPDGLPINADFYWVRHLKIAYVTVWASGPYCPETIPTLFDRLTEALNEAAAAESLPCEFYQLKTPSMNGYVGRLYKVRDCYFKGGIRHYYKIEGKRLTVVGVGVMSEIPDDPEIGRFLESFKITKYANQ